MADRSDEILLQLLELRKDLDNTVVRQLVKVYETFAPALEQARQETHQKLHVINQTANLTARMLSRNKSRPLRCVFLIHMAEAWDALAPVYEAMKQAADFEPIVITIPRVLPAEEGGINEEKTHLDMERQGVPHLRFYMSGQGGLDILKALQPDLLFRQQHWDKLIPPAYDTTNLNFTRLCYVPYSYLSVRRFSADEEGLDTNGSPRHADQLFHRMCWRIFCETEMHKEMHDKVGARRGGNVIMTGYPKFDQLMERAKMSSPFWPVADRGGKRPFRIIWAPHHAIGSDWLGFGTFPRTYKEMLQWARQETGMDFVLKPHPHLRQKMTEAYKLMTPEQYDAYLAEWESLPNTAIVYGGDYGPLFMASDLLLTDGVSFLTEYPLFDKPQIFIDSGHHCGFNKAGEVPMECTHTVQTLAEARALCERLARGEPDPKANLRPGVIARLMPYPGQSAERIIEAIREGLAQEMAA